VPRDQAHGEFIGLAMLSERGTSLFTTAYKDALKTFAAKPFHESSSLQKASFTDMVQELIDRGIEIHCISIYKGWMEVDSFEEYQQAWAKLRQ